MGFLRQQWYAAAWSDDIALNDTLARTIIGEPLLMWRSPTGQLRVLADICPHRLVPLSRGKREGDGIRCGYHGLKFGADGACIDNPHGPIVSKLRVRSYPVIERHKMIWVWMGEPARAQLSQVTDMRFADQVPEHAFSKGYLPTAAGHKLMEDNILDLSHADYLHPDTLGGGSLTRSRAKVTETKDGVLVQWLVWNELAIPLLRVELATPDAPADMWTEVQWHPNGVMLLRVGATPSGKAREEGIETQNAHIMTPETERRTHYFFFNARNYRIHDAAYNAQTAAILRVAFETEDKPMIEAQQRLLGDADLFDSRPTLLSIDAGSTRARRIYQRLLRSEVGDPEVVGTS
jgi:phenylpropionate dioxygenase-like ring-hydroxylating dioxygenase large terminal subunit